MCLISAISILPIAAIAPGSHSCSRANDVRPRPSLPTGGWSQRSRRVLRMFRPISIGSCPTRYLSALALACLTVVCAVPVVAVAEGQEREGKWEQDRKHLYFHRTEKCQATFRCRAIRVGEGPYEQFRSTTKKVIEGRCDVAPGNKKKEHPLVDGTNIITAGDMIQAVSVQAQNLFTGFCGIEVSGGRGKDKQSATLIAPPLSYSDWTFLLTSFTQRSWRISVDKKCDTPVKLKIKYWGLNGKCSWCRVDPPKEECIVIPIITAVTVAEPPDVLVITPRIKWAASMNSMATFSLSTAMLNSVSFVFCTVYQLTSSSET